MDDFVVHFNVCRPGLRFEQLSAFDILERFPDPLWCRPCFDTSGRPGAVDAELCLVRSMRDLTVLTRSVAESRAPLLATPLIFHRDADLASRALLDELEAFRAVSLERARTLVEVPPDSSLAVLALRSPHYFLSDFTPGLAAKAALRGRMFSPATVLTWLDEDEFDQLEASRLVVVRPGPLPADMLETAITFFDPFGSADNFEGVNWPTAVALAQRL